MITPAEARQLNAIDQKAIAAWEAKIDEALRAYDGQRIQVGVEGTSPKMRSHLKQMYEVAGWRVDVNYGDQRDPGPWFSFIG